MQKVDKEKTRYYLAKIHILFRGNFRTQVLSARPCPFLQCSLTDECPFFLFFRTAGDIHHAYVNFYKKLLVLYSRKCHNVKEVSFGIENLEKGDRK
jgi:hypothetical protein